MIKIFNEEHENTYILKEKPVTGRQGTNVSQNFTKTSIQYPKSCALHDFVKDVCVSKLN